ncbi:MAG: hypothetical protein CVT95_12550 [Bacteroidetes bacterium HGW-Bacteroidetes-12]|nr:MAG: hypothetical protein CVT95_12550 [Bacteroidetes bacterium HGW-Bacteroidetes-12]
MKRKYIYILIGLITSALIGLVAIQIYWINSAITLKEDGFRNDVTNSLIAVAQKIEKLETINRVKKHQHGQAMFKKRANSIRESFNFKNEASYDTSAVFEENGVKYKISERQQKKSNQVLYQKSIQSVSDKGQFGFQFSMGSKNNFNQENSYSDSIYRYKENEKSILIDEILESLYEMNRFRGVKERVEHIAIDSLIKEELTSRGIKTEFVFGIFDYDGNDVLREDTLKNTHNIRMSGYWAQIFPNDIFDTPHFLSIFFPHKTGFLLKSMWMMLLSSIVLLLIIIWAFTFTIQTIFKQKKLSEIKNDFINNMTHELKTPISTISLACEALNDKDLCADDNIKHNYVNMIHQENERLGILVERVLKSATWDKTDLKLNKEIFDFHEVLKNVIENISIQIVNKNGIIHQKLEATNTKIKADKVHVVNLIYNLLDNANKYSPNQPEITVCTKNSRDGIVFSVSDKGLGIKKENVTKIFEKFYRVPTGDVHNVKGFGLGLNYVKAIVDKHQGEINVMSEIKKGTTFQIYLPYEGN